MDYQEFRSLFQQSFLLNSIQEPTEDQIMQFYSFTEHLLKINQTTNLTAIRSIPDIIAKHYIDSLLASEFIPTGARVLDIGCGPGFPSLPLAITRKDLKIVALDSTQKKIAFVQSTAELLKLHNLTAISARAEDHELLTKLGRFDIVTSRAVARLNMLCELTLPYLKTGGSLIALKSTKAEDELAEAKNAISILGGACPVIHAKKLHCADTIEERNIITATKAKSTPAIYPRPFAAIKKKPL